MVSSLAAKIFPPKATTAPARRISIWKASAQVETPAHARSLRSRAKFLLRAWTRPRLTQVWLSRLVQPDVSPLWTLRPRLATKLQRPYVSAEWGAAERFAALLGHYTLLPRLLAPRAMELAYASGLDLLELHHTTTDRRLRLRLCYQDQFEKEGELTLAVVEGTTGLTLAGLTFCLAQNTGRRIAIIGGLQAHPDPRIRRLIHEVAKEMHGLRPKAFALWALQQLCTAWQIEELQGVCDTQHIYRHRHKRRQIAASYDEFWGESDGRQLPGGSWALPLQPRLRPREELKASRRKQHERRYALLGEIQTQLLAALLDYSPGPTVAQIPLQPRVFSFVTKEPAAPAANPSASAPAPAQSSGPAQSRPPALNHSY